MMSAWTNDFASPARAAVMEVHGTGDQITLRAGDPQNRDGWGAYLGTEAVMDFWVRKLALEKSDTTELPKLQPQKNARIRLRRWWATADLAEVRLYEIQDAGHRWPGNVGNPEISTAAEIWHFFQRHRPP